ncbi:MAG: nucleotidyltransferase family protein [Salinivirgaceae bacterium]|jgi:dTDP-glucose pyrophosphorylase|nr:nucleotidyltransferase family protein [Salinivirgaceae bacterium]
MFDYNNLIINESDNVRHAMKRLLDIPRALTLFVVDKNEKLIGTLTDGDIRRGFVSGLSLEDTVNKFMFKDFACLTRLSDMSEVKTLRKRGVKLLPVIDEKHRISKVYDLTKLKSILPLVAVIMAGGKGKRLKPITDSIPKPMIKLGNKPIIEHNIDRLISYGIETIYISVNYKKEQIMDYFGDGKNKGISIRYIEEDKPLGTIGALSLVEQFESDVLLSNSDLFTNIDYEDLYLNYLKKDADMAIASIPYTVNIPYAIFEEENNKIKGFKEKPSNTHFANAGIYIIKNSLLKYIPKNQFYNTTDLMEACITNKKTIIHNPIIGYWIDIGKMDDLKKAELIAKHL